MVCLYLLRVHLGVIINVINLINKWSKHASFVRALTDSAFIWFREDKNYPNVLDSFYCLVWLMMFLYQSRQISLFPPGFLLFLHIQMDFNHLENLPGDCCSVISCNSTVSSSAYISSHWTWAFPSPSKLTSSTKLGGSFQIFLIQHPSPLLPGGEPQTFCPRVLWASNTSVCPTSPDVKWACAQSSSEQIRMKNAGQSDHSGWLEIIVWLVVKKYDGTLWWSIGGVKTWASRGRSSICLLKYWF